VAVVLVAVVLEPIMNINIVCLSTKIPVFQRYSIEVRLFTFTVFELVR